jgi:putative FmdB family regulatory protein
MPIYEYRCNACSQRFEILIRSRADEADCCCPSCGGRGIKRLISAGCVRPQGVPRGSGGFTPPKCAPSGSG